MSDFTEVAFKVISGVISLGQATYKMHQVHKRSENLTSKEKVEIGASFVLGVATFADVGFESKAFQGNRLITEGSAQSLAIDSTIKGVAASAAVTKAVVNPKYNKLLTSLNVMDDVSEAVVGVVEDSPSINDRSLLQTAGLSINVLGASISAFSAFRDNKTEIKFSEDVELTTFRYEEVEQAEFYLTKDVSNDGAKQEEYLNDRVLGKFICPISKKPIIKCIVKVMLAQKEIPGLRFEKAAIDDWLKENREKDFSFLPGYSEQVDLRSIKIRKDLYNQGKIDVRLEQLGIQKIA